MIVTKANAKENLGKLICLSIAKANAKTNLQIFICNHFCVDGTRPSGSPHFPNAVVLNAVGRRKSAKERKRKSAKERQKGTDHAQKKHAKKSSIKNFGAPKTPPSKFFM